MNSFHCIANIGDINPLEHGGQFVRVDRLGRAHPTLSIWDPDRSTLYDVEIPQCIPTHVDACAVRICTSSRLEPEWFGDRENLFGVASFVGDPPMLFIHRLCSSDPVERARAYHSLFMYHGSLNFDSQPLQLSPREAKQFCSRMLKEIRAAEKWDIHA